jgi:LCP family protein required for cell wall assembly
MTVGESGDVAGRGVGESGDVAGRGVGDEIRRAFARHEHLVPDANSVRPGIAALAVRRRVRRRAFQSVGVALVALAVVATALAVRAWPSRPSSQPPAAAATALDGPLNFLLLGLDDSATAGARDSADTIIVAHVPADRSRVYLITIPRDTWVDNGPGQPQIKLNRTYALGGFPQLAAAVTGLTGLSFDGAATVDLVGLGKLTDALGGVDFCVDYKVTSIHTGHSFVPGCRHFDGADATDYLRQRTDIAGVPPTDPSAGFGALLRDRHQVAYLRAVLKKATAAQLLADPVHLNTILAAAGSALVVDTRDRKVSDVLREVAPALPDTVGIAAPPGDNVQHTDSGSGPVSGFEPTADGRAFFAAVKADQVAGWLAAHPSALMFPTPSPS